MGDLAEDLLVVKCYISKPYPKMCPCTGGGDVYISNNVRPQPSDPFDPEGDAELGEVR